ncbi:type II secretion system F family protein [Kitasatospora sp. MMS16-BH015]|uniref:type II secretion system F family protein n=1 Tax=Kitasatospora sp. MMS16-BH015 TaxID=2018025 RepID=UPI0020C44D96|nr:type II secretion system F family protein [Kitasatospora sp. MMS16-BH015]
MARLRRRSRTVRRAVGLVGAPTQRGTAGWAVRLRRRRPAWLVAELLLLPVGLLLARATASPVPAMGAVAAVLPLRRWCRRRRETAEARRRTTSVIELCEGLAAELRSGSTPEQALHTVTSRGSSLRDGLGAASTTRLAAGRYGGDTPAALRGLAELPGGRGGAALAACWQITAESGVGLATGLDQVADALRAERSLAEEIAGELAAPRATVAVLAALPLVGLLLGAALGARPVRVLLHTPAGLLCLAAGVALEVIGLAWTNRIIRAVAEPTLWQPEAAPSTVPGASGPRSSMPRPVGAKARSVGTAPAWEASSGAPVASARPRAAGSEDTRLGLRSVTARASRTRRPRARLAGHRARLKPGARTGAVR